MIKSQYRKTPDIFPLHHIRVVDGDTLEATVALPFDFSVVKRIRLKGWWADEPVGIYAQQGLCAKRLLEVFLEGKAIWLHAPSARLDKYGRIVGSILHGSEIVDPRKVLGNYQLTEKEHKARRDQQAAAFGKRLAASGGMTANTLSFGGSKGPINDPEAILDLKSGENDCFPEHMPPDLPSREATNPDREGGRIG